MSLQLRKAVASGSMDKSKSESERAPDSMNQTFLTAGSLLELREYSSLIHEVKFGPEPNSPSTANI